MLRHYYCTLPSRDLVALLGLPTQNYTSDLSFYKMVFKFSRIPTDFILLLYIVRPFRRKEHLLLGLGMGLCNHIRDTKYDLKMFKSLMKLLVSPVVS